MRKFRIMPLLIVLVMVGGLLTGCHGSKGMEAFSAPEEFDTNKNYEITFWAKNDTNKAQTKIYEDAIASFEDFYPNITVKLRLYTNYVDIYNDVITNISTNTTPNVCITYPDHIATYLTGENVVVPLDDLFENEKYGLGGSDVHFKSVTRDEIIPEFLDECIIDEKHYAIPYMRSTEACYINKDMVEALGYEVPDVLTWDFIWEVSEKATEKNSDGTYKINGQNVMIPFIYKSTDNMMIQYLAQSGNAEDVYSDREGNIKVFNDTTRDFLFEISEHAGTGAFSTFKISSYPANFLNAGQCIFAVDSTAGATWMGSKAPLCDISEDKIIDFETVVRPVPQVDVNNLKMISQGPSICLFNKKDSGEVLASWLFAQFMLTNDVQMPYSMTEGYVPVTSKARETVSYQNYLESAGSDNEIHYDVKLAATKLLLENTENTFVTPVFNGSASLRDASGQLIENVTKSTRRKENVNETYVNNLYESVKSLYRLGSTNVSVGKKDLGPLPAMSKAIIIVLAIVWVLIVIYVIIDKRKARKN